MTNAQYMRVLLTLILAFMLFAVLKLAQQITAPTVFALVLGVVMAPLTDWITRRGVPHAGAAFLTLFLALFAVVALILSFGPIIAEAVGRAPYLWSELQQTLRGIMAFVRGMNEMTEDVKIALDAAGTGGTGAEGSDISIPSVAEALSYTPALAGQLMVFIGTFYFFVLSRREIYDWVGRSSVRVTRDCLLQAEAQVSRYFLTITAINASFAVLVTVALYFMGMPSPHIWGILAFLLNFVLYLGPAVLAASLLVAGLIAFDGAMSFVPAAAYIAMNMTEGQFVTPALIGQRMSINPLLVFSSLVFWLWLWGPVGGVIAIPILVWVLKIDSARTACASNDVLGDTGQIAAEPARGS